MELKKLLHFGSPENSDSDAMVTPAETNTAPAEPDKVLPVDRTLITRFMNDPRFKRIRDARSSGDEPPKRAA
jgi:hypothetical protein